MAERKSRRMTKKAAAAAKPYEKKEPTEPVPESKVDIIRGEGESAGETSIVTTPQELKDLLQSLSARFTNQDAKAAFGEWVKRGEARWAGWIDKGLKIRVIFGDGDGSSALFNNSLYIRETPEREVTRQIYRISGVAIPPSKIEAEELRKRWGESRPVAEKQFVEQVAPGGTLHKTAQLLIGTSGKSTFGSIVFSDIVPTMEAMAGPVAEALQWIKDTTEKLGIECECFAPDGQFGVFKAILLA